VYIVCINGNVTTNPSVQILNTNKNVRKQMNKNFVEEERRREGKKKIIIES
jgi:hypothetical protein